MTESQLKTKVQAYLKSIDAFYMKISDRFSIGIPDLCVVHNNRTIWIELKTDKGKVSLIQQWHIRMINSHGGEAHVCRSVNDVRAIIERTNSKRAGGNT